MSEKPFVVLFSSNRSFLGYSWVCFFLFLISLSLLSNLVFSLEIRLWIEVFGLFLPFVFGLILSAKNRSTTWTIGHNPLFPQAWFFLFFIVLLGTRFYRLSSLPSWPLSDESVFASLALDMDRHWNGSFVVSGWQIEPMLLWSLALFFKLIPASLATLRLFTAFWSLAGAAAAYAAARAVWNRTTAAVFALLFSFSFWALGLSRQCASYDLIPFFELTAFWLVGLYAKSSGKRWQNATLLGLWTGLGFYTYVNWVVVWAGVLLFLLSLDLRKEYPKILLYLALSLGIASPWMAARFTAHGLGYFKASFLSPVFWPACFLDYLRGLFWNGSASFPLGPAQGGYFDSLTGALIATGILAAVRALSRKNLFILGAALLFSFVPGVLTNNLELQRLTPALPIFIFLALFGLWALLGTLQGLASVIGWSLALWTVLALNWAQLAGPYDDFHPAFTRNHWRSADYFEAYRILSERNQKDGPGYVLNEWNADYYDKTLDLACRPFNVITTSNLPAAQWVAFLTDADYTPQLRKRFPHLVVYSLDPAADRDHLLRLFIAPIPDFSPKTLKTWLAADADTRQANQNILQHDRMTPYASLAGGFASLAQLYVQDPFLASALWERTASFFLMDQDYPGAAVYLERALRADPSVPHLNHNLQLVLSLGKH